MAVNGIYADRWLLRITTLNAMEKILIGDIAMLNQRGNDYDITTDEIMDRLGFSRNTVNRILRMLIGDGILKSIISFGKGRGKKRVLVLASPYEDMFTRKVPADIKREDIAKCLYR